MVCPQLGQEWGRTNLMRQLCEFRSRWMMHMECKYACNRSRSHGARQTLALDCGQRACSPRPGLPSFPSLNPSHPSVPGSLFSFPSPPPSHAYVQQRAASSCPGFPYSLQPSWPEPASFLLRLRQPKGSALKHTASSSSSSVWLQPLWSFPVCDGEEMAS